tara:strand:+ start:734 stop:1750 length:1017 start_codon:yes stop_codon:yes gene_type:complete
MKEKKAKLSSSKTFSILSSKEKANWENILGKDFISEANLRKTSSLKMDYELELGHIGELRVVKSKIKIDEPRELVTDFDFSKKEKKIDILQEFYVLKGQVQVNFKTKKVLLESGDILVIDNTDLPSSIKILQDTDIISIYMPLSLVKSWIPRIWENLESKVIKFPGDSSVLLGKYLSLVADFAIKVSNKEKGESYQPKAIIPLIMANLSMLVFALGDLEEEKPSRIKDIQLDAAKQFMLTHMSDSSLSPKIISKELGISVRYLHWIFKESKEQETVSQYLTRKRLELAQLLLATSNNSLYSVTEVAFMCGFNDSTHFSRRFKQGVGISPSQYRINNLS